MNAPTLDRPETPPASFVLQVRVAVYRAGENALPRHFNHPLTTGEFGLIRSTRRGMETPWFREDSLLDIASSSASSMGVHTPRVCKTESLGTEFGDVIAKESVAGEHMQSCTL